MPAIFNTAQHLPTRPWPAWQQTANIQETQGHEFQIRAQVKHNFGYQQTLERTHVHTQAQTALQHVWISALTST